MTAIKKKINRSDWVLCFFLYILILGGIWKLILFLNTFFLFLFGVRTFETKHEAKQIWMIQICSAAPVQLQWFRSSFNYRMSHLNWVKCNFYIRDVKLPKIMTICKARKILARLWMFQCDKFPIWIILWMYKALGWLEKIKFIYFWKFNVWDYFQNIVILRSLLLDNSLI